MTSLDLLAVLLVMQANIRSSQALSPSDYTDPLGHLP